MVAYCEHPDFLNNVVLPLVGVSFSLMILLLALFWMAAQFFRKAEYESFVSLEMHQLLVSALLVMFIFGAAYFSCEVAAGFAGGDMFEISSSYLSSINNDIAVRAVLYMEGLKMFSQYWGSMSFRWGASAWGVGAAGFPSFIVIERVADFLLMLITPFAASLMVQQIILETIKGTAIAFVLPVGAVLRIFPPTRDAGSFLMASALGFQIIYPFTYVMQSNIVPKIYEGVLGEKTLDEIYRERGWEEFSLIAIFEKGLFDLQQMLVAPVRSLSILLLQALFLPALSMILTISFIKGTAKFFSQKLG